MRIIWNLIKLNTLLLILIFGILVGLSSYASSAEFDCSTEKKYSMLWYYNECDGGTKLEIKKVDTRDTPWKGYPYNSGEIPQDATPDNKILKHYLKKYISYGKPSEMNRVVIKIKKDKKKIKEFKFNTKTDDFVIEQLNQTALLSYLMYVNVPDPNSQREDIIRIMKDSNRFWKIRNMILSGKWDNLELLEIQEQLEEYIDKGQKINAIKYYREIMSTHMGEQVTLREAKDVIDSFAQNRTLDITAK